MKIPFFQIDAFSQKVFTGNPAFVAVLEQDLSDEQMQAIAYENNLPASVFLQKTVHGYAIRWFTMEESDLCGHGSLAAAHVVFNFLEPELTQVKFTSRKGLEIMVHKQHDDSMLLDFPAKNPVREASIPPQVQAALAENPVAFLSYKHERCLIVLENEAQVQAAKPDLLLLSELPWSGYVLTAPGDAVDFVSRTFYPRKKVFTEDYVTGASHCVLTPYWTQQLNKAQLTAKQLSSRGGWLNCEFKGDHVKISGYAVLYASGELYL